MERDHPPASPFAPATSAAKRTPTKMVFDRPTAKVKNRFTAARMLPTVWLASPGGPSLGCLTFDDRFSQHKIIQPVPFFLRFPRAPIVVVFSAVGSGISYGFLNLFISGYFYVAHTATVTVTIRLC